MLDLTRQDSLRIALIAFVTLAVATSGLVSSVQTAAAASMVNLWAVPVNSCIDDGKLQILRLKFNLENVNPLEMVRITLDPGTPDEMILEFDANGNILTSDPAFVSVEFSSKLKVVLGDYYYYSIIEKLKGKGKIGIDKTELSVGMHEALAEVFVEGQVDPTLSDDASFKLRACEEGQPDLLAEFYGAPANMEQDKKYNTFFIESNIGNGKAGPHEVKVYLSSDAVLDTSVDELVGEKHTGALPVNPVRMVHIKVEIPCGPDTGDMFLIAWTDADEEVSEILETNNMAMDEVNVIGCEEDSVVEAAEADDDDSDDDDEKGNKGKGKGKKDD